jgi:hypothetical protein
LAKFQDVAFLSERNREFNEKRFWGRASRDLFTLSGTSEAENTSSFLAKPSDILTSESLRIPSHYLEIDRISRLFAKIVNLHHLALSICHRKHRAYLLEGACEKLSS